jgi:hypothetical protein
VFRATKQLRGMTFQLLPLVVLILFFSICYAGFAQVGSASLAGEVTDPTGAAIPGASVTVKNADTNLVGASTSNEQGAYRIAPLPPGTYTLTVATKGFSTYVQQGIILTVALAATQNVTLKPGTAEQTVQVTANAELLNTTSASIGMAINSEAITQLPLNGRDPQSLVFLAPGITNGTNEPGVAVNQGGFTFPAETGASSGAGAGRAGSTYYLLDGVPNTDQYLGLAAPFPNADATQEFRVITNNFNPQYGFAPGAVVTIQTKSGTNAFHGAVWEFLRNKSFNASNWFSHTVDPLHQNQFGGALGGPILKNRLFFFTNYQGTRQSTASTSNFVYSFTPAMLNGDFSGVPQTLNAPFATINGKPNQINPALYNPAAVEIAKTAVPVGQQANGGVFYQAGTLINDYDEGTGRIDYTISQSQRIFARAFIDYLSQPGDGTPGNILSYQFANRLEDYSGAAGHTWIVNPKIVNVASLFVNQIDTAQGGTGLLSNGQPFCWSKFIAVNDPPGTCSYEGFSVSNGFSSPYLEPCGVNRSTFGLYDNLTVEEGRNNLSFGINAQYQDMSLPCGYPALPIISFNGQYTNNGLSDFLLGDIASYYQGAGSSGSFHQWQTGFYGDDQYRLRPNLTLNAGLRWDPNFPWQITAGRGATFVPGQQSTIYPNAPTGLVFPGDKGIGGGLMRTTYGYWQPRVGVSWQPRLLPHTSFHAGFGLFTAPLISSANDHTNENSPFAPTYTLNGTTTTPVPLDNPWSVFPGTGGTSPFPPFANAAETYRPPPSATFTPGLSIQAAVDPAYKLGVTQAWNLATEQQIGANMMFRLAYVGSQSYHQSVIIDRNPGIYATGGTRSTYTDFGQITYSTTPATASYHALQATIERRLSHNLQFQSNFTWSKLVDIATSANIAFQGGLANPFNLGFNRGISNANVPLIWVSNFIYTTPRLSGRNQLLRQTLGGWEVSAIIVSHSGTPFSVSGGFGNNNSGSLQYEDYADRVPGQPLGVRTGGKSHWLNNYFNINAFTENAPGTFGNSGRNIMIGPPVNYTDAGLYKNWTIYREYSLQFRWEMYNAFNHPNFGTPNTTNQIGPDGSSVGGTEGVITALGSEPPRIMQGGLKITF